MIAVLSDLFASNCVVVGCETVLLVPLHAAAANNLW
jgi:hypothetical protein